MPAVAMVTEEERYRLARAGMRTLSDVIYILGVTLISHLISRRVRLEDISSLHGLRQVSLPRLLTVATFCDSWVFLFASSILVHGLSLELNEAVCTSGIAICIGFYVTSKIFLFLFLSEKVHIVWSSTQGCPRIKSPIYMACMLVILMYTSVGVYLVWERIAYFEDLGRVCIIGLKRLGSVLLLSYDVCSNVTLLIMFLWPLHRARVRNLYLRSIALRAIYATLIMLTSSTVNIVVLTAMDGRETGWVCLVSFSGDIIVNAAVLFWATSGSSLRPAAPAGAIDGAFTPSGAFVGPVCLPTTSECTESTVVISEGDVEEVYGSEWCVSVLPMPISKPCLELSVITEQDEKDMSTMSLEELDEEDMKRE